MNWPPLSLLVFSPLFTAALPVVCSPTGGALGNSGGHVADAGLE